MAGAQTSKAAAVSYAVGDHATADDTLGFASYVEAVAAVLTSKQTSPPLTMSIEGEWGSGKSSFMLQLEKAIAGASRRDILLSALPPRWGGPAVDGSLAKAFLAVYAAPERRPFVIRFNAWRHDKQDALWAAFALTVTAKLRERAGRWQRFVADFRLFRMRLREMELRGYLELGLLLLSVALLAFSGWVLLLHLRQLGNGHALQYARSVLNDDKKLDAVLSRLLTRESAVHGSWAAMLLLACGGIVKFADQFKLPISIELKKYISKPDYKGHSAFIESFHEDFVKVVRAYAGDERIFVFIDDLDRCDVPRAAELMQAINLMISDAGNLVFVLGMDREKVAAGLAQKYKDLLPYLPEYEKAAGGTSVAFGYSYLEKFIQLTFTLPAMAGEDSLTAFLDGLVPVPLRPTWGRTFRDYWSPRMTSAWQRRGPAAPADQEHREAPPVQPGPQASTTSQAATEAERTVLIAKRVRRLRRRLELQPEQMREIIAMVSPVFGNNPRRLKQFLSTFRLAQAIADSQGILYLLPQPDGITMQQLGKFIALTMRFPDLRSALREDLSFLEKLETFTLQQEVTADHEYWHWLHGKAVRGLLKYKAITVPAAPSPFGTGDAAERQYTLAGLDLSLLLTLLPKAVPGPEAEPVGTEAPPASEPAEPTEAGADPPPRSAAPEPQSRFWTRTSQGSSEGEGEAKRRFPELLRSLAAEYERIRQTMEASHERTRTMTVLVERIQAECRQTSGDSNERMLAQMLDQPTDGNRIVALGIACARVRQNHLPWLIAMLAEYRSPFEHYWTIRTLLLHERFLGPEDASAVVHILKEQMPAIEQDAGRRQEAYTLLERASRLAQTLEVPSR